MFGPSKKLSRLGQWDGRRHSSRADEAVLPRLWQRPMVVRLGVVLLTTIAVTAMVHAWGPLLPYRLGQITPYDLRVRVDFAIVNQVELVNQALTQRSRDGGPRSTTVPVDAGALTEKARTAERPIIEQYPLGMLLVEGGKPITGRQLALLDEERRAYEHSLGHGARVRRGIALFLIFSLLAGLIVVYVARFQVGLAQSLPTIMGVCALVVLTLGLAMLLSHRPWHAAIIPLTLTAMVFTIVYNHQFALLMSFSLTLALSVALGSDLSHLLQQMGGLAAAVLLLRNLRTRTRLVKVGTGAGLAYLVMTVATGILSGQTWQYIASDAIRNFLWGTLAGFLLTGLLPVVERCFGIITDISLLELADGSHPLLQELVRRAPGTYTHSMTVATLAEAAAEAIGANPLLTRVGSYFHDIGKMLKAQYFIENQTGENRHDALEPALSTLIIIGHVKDGLALAKEYNLPRPIMAFIEQHHGTTLVEYFYREAMRLHESHGHSTAALEPSFRYPGPKPQNRENGILMLADAVESSSRALTEPTPGSLHKLVHDLLMKRLLDGQFEESGLTLTELHLVEDSLRKSLTALFHSRIRYPEPEEAALAS
jgi:putative nucleotidyltransferase with HDIG domain